MGICCCCLGACCFNSALTRSLEIAIIVLNSISVILLILCLVLIKWKEIYSSNLYLFIIMLVLNFICLIISILVRCWGSSGSIKTTQKGTASCLSMFGLILSIFIFIISLVEEIIATISFRKANFPCLNFNNNNNYYIPYYRRMEYEEECRKFGDDYDRDVITVGQYFIAFATISYLEIGMIFIISLWCILRTRIIGGLDGPAVRDVTVGVPVQQRVIVVQPGYAYNTPYVYNQQVIPPSSDDYNYQY